MKTEDIVLEVGPLGMPWPTLDPFLFCVHHDDAYPEGNERLGPRGPLSGRALGNDFEGVDGWRMYHGEVVPGFPQHPHRGFETVTLARRGLVDHSDSMGATARYGQGDVQWLTAGRGIVHCEMFPLVNAAAPNPLELFQIWLNLPRAQKLADPHFSMFWAPTVPRAVLSDAAGRRTEVVAVAGALGELRPPAPPPASWAARADSDVAIWTFRLDPGARFEVPAAKATSNRVLYLFRGAARIGGEALAAPASVRVRPDVPVVLENGGAESELLLLQGRPIGEPVVSYGPFVMNTQEEIRQAFADYRETGFGGWPWKTDDPVHARDRGRFARLPNGSELRP